MSDDREAQVITADDVGEAGDVFGEELSPEQLAAAEQDAVRGQMLRTARAHEALGNVLNTERSGHAADPGQLASLRELRDDLHPAVAGYADAVIEKHG